ncbi:hypothetical protein BKA70DRAFT_1230057 [Coprinopsis sp. MPI-PUGE-AT-0042]|nr:hypothetical protein BKA70DRAFT_1230057 [Coprinopsis sp. MPI-PUGE-AT-0042]
MASHGSASESSTSRRGVTTKKPSLQKVLASCGSMIEDRLMMLDQAPQSVPSSATSVDNDWPGITTDPIDHHGRANRHARDHGGPSVDPYSQAGTPWHRNNLGRNPSPSGRYGTVPTFPSTSSATSATPMTPPPTYHGSSYVPDSPRSGDDYGSHFLPDDIYDNKVAEDYDEPAARSSQVHLPGSINIVGPSDDGHSVDNRDAALHYQPVVQASSWSRTGSVPPSEALEATLETFYLQNMRADEQKDLVDQYERRPSTDGYPAASPEILERIKEALAQWNGTVGAQLLLGVSILWPQRLRSTFQAKAFRPLHNPLSMLKTHTSGYLPTFGYAPSFQSGQGDPTRFSIGSTIPDQPEPRKSTYVKLLDSTLGAVIGPFLGRRKSSKNLGSSSTRASPAKSSPAPRDPAHGGTRQTPSHPPTPAVPLPQSRTPVGPSRNHTPTAGEPPPARVSRQEGTSDQHHSQARTACDPDDHRFWNLDPASPIFSYQRVEYAVARPSTIVTMGTFELTDVDEMHGVEDVGWVLHKRSSLVP